MDSKKKKELEDLIDNALKHEDDLQHDGNKDPVAFIDESDDEN